MLHIVLFWTTCILMSDFSVYPHAGNAQIITVYLLHCFYLVTELKQKLIINTPNNFENTKYFIWNKSGKLFEVKIFFENLKGKETTTLLSNKCFILQHLNQIWRKFSIRKLQNIIQIKIWGFIKHLHTFRTKSWLKWTVEGIFNLGTYSKNQNF